MYLEIHPGFSRGGTFDRCVQIVGSLYLVGKLHGAGEIRMPEESIALPAGHFLAQGHSGLPPFPLIVLFVFSWARVCLTPGQGKFGALGREPARPQRPAIDLVMSSTDTLHPQSSPTRWRLVVGPGGAAT